MGSKLGIAIHWHRVSISCGIHTVVCEVYALAVPALTTESHVKALLALVDMTWVCPTRAVEEQLDKLGRGFGWILTGHYFDLSSELLLHVLILDFINSEHLCLASFLWLDGLHGWLVHGRTHTHHHLLLLLHPWLVELLRLRTYTHVLCSRRAKSAQKHLENELSFQTSHI